ncbi:MAG: PPOX class F420-dependent oxidoreductase [Acidimicrobiia bacterium]
MQLQPALDFAADRHLGVILTINQDGRPHASNIGYAIWDGAVHISTRAHQVKIANLRRDDRAGLHVTSDDFGSWVVIEGRAALSLITTDPDDDTAALLRRTYEAIRGPHPDWDEFNQAMIDQRRLVVSLAADSAYGRIG